MKDYLQIDILKAFSIFGVIFVHTIPTYLVIKGQFVFTFWQSVPMFIIISGITSSLSLSKKEDFFDKGLFLKNYYSYLLKRFKRILPSLALIFIASTFLWIILDLILNNIESYGFGVLTLIGNLPFTGPGNYYISLLIQLILIFPFIFYFFKKSPISTLVIMFIINFVFEAFISHISLFDNNSYYYKISILRYFSALGLGMYLSNDFKLFSKQNIFILSLAPLSCVYIFMGNNFDYQFYLFPSFWKTQTMIAVFYPTVLVLMGLNFIPSRTKNKVLSVIQNIGKKSYHIFLVQILYYPCKNLYINSILNSFPNKGVLYYILLVLFDFIICYIAASFLIHIEKILLDKLNKLELSKSYNSAS